MDIVTELAVREAMFEELDRRIALSGDGNLSWELTERFSFLGEPIAMRQARGPQLVRGPARRGALESWRGHRSLPASL